MRREIIQRRDMMRKDSDAAQMAKEMDAVRKKLRVGRTYTLYTHNSGQNTPDKVVCRRMRVGRKTEHYVRFMTDTGFYTCYTCQELVFLLKKPQAGVRIVSEQEDIDE